MMGSASERSDSAAALESAQREFNEHAGQGDANDALEDDDKSDDGEEFTVYMRFTKDDSQQPFTARPSHRILEALEKTLVGSARHFRYNVFFCEEHIEDEESTFDGE